MNPDLIKAIKERMELDHSAEEIHAALRAAGYDDDSVTKAYSVAEQELKHRDVVMADSPDFSPIPENHEMLGVMDLFKGGCSFLLSRVDIVLWLLLPMLVLTVASNVTYFQVFNNPPIIAVAAFVAVVAFVLYILNIGAALFAVSEYSEKKVNYKEGLAWAKKNFWNLLWVYILSGLAVMGGMVLLIIPGIMVAVYLYFVQYTFVAENKRGFEALLRSHELVKGIWWKIFWKMFGLAALIVVCIVFVSIILFVVWNAVTGHDPSRFVEDTWSQIVGVPWTIIFLHAGWRMFNSIRTDKLPAENTIYKNQWKYKVLAILGLLAIPLLIGLSFLGSEFESSVSGVQKAIIANQLSSSVTSAEVFYADNNDSYEGVCGSLVSNFEGADEISCNDSEDEWALSVELDEGVTVCADGSAYVKEIKIPLEERTKCLPV